MALAGKAFGHLDQQRPSVVEAKKWLNRRASRASRATSATGMSNYGAMEAGADECRPIAEVVNWPLIVQKYLESIGESTKTDDDDLTSQAEGGDGEGDAGGGAGDDGESTG